MSSAVILLWQRKFNRIVRCWDKTSSHYTETVSQQIFLDVNLSLLGQTSTSGPTSSTAGSTVSTTSAPLKQTGCDPITGADLTVGQGIYSKRVVSEEEERRMRNEALAREIPVERFDDDYKESSLD